MDSVGEVIPSAGSRPSDEERALEVVDLGHLDYEQALERQESRLAAVQGGSRPALLLVEHPHVYTIGRGGDAENLRHAPETLGVPVFRVRRGGDATYHGPGQVVAYPILRLQGPDRNIRLYLRRLEEVILRTLSAFGIRGTRVEGRTGVWVGEKGRRRKIASIGVGVRRWTTCHGLALNVSTALEYFDAIVPCALDGVEMTSMEKELRESVRAGAVRARLIADFAEVFGLRTVGPLSGAVPRRGRRWTTRVAESRPGVSGERKPPWLKARIPSGDTYFRTRRTLDGLGLNTVCQEAFCPNIAECWGHSTATFMILGDTCTRSCGFCAVKHGLPGRVDPAEPGRVAEAAERLGLRHVVVTSVDRDDLPDGGAGHFAATARAIKERQPDCAVEVLVPDFRGDLEAVRTVVESPVDVFNHNTETVPSLYPTVRPGARYERSLVVLRRAGELRPELRVKSGLMVGLGETDEELFRVFRQLHEHGCDILTVGQYLRPTKEHLPVDRWVTPEEFDLYRREALAVGFRHVESGPFVRSSYHAWEHVK